MEHAVARTESGPGAAAPAEGRQPEGGAKKSWTLLLLGVHNPAPEFANCTATTFANEAKEKFRERCPGAALVFDTGRLHGAGPSRESAALIRSGKKPSFDTHHLFGGKRLPGVVSAEELFVTSGVHVKPRRSENTTDVFFVLSVGEAMDHPQHVPEEEVHTHHFHSEVRPEKLREKHMIHAETVAHYALGARMADARKHDVLVVPPGVQFGVAVDGKLGAYLHLLKISFADEPPDCGG
jgi:hypothetical protein